MIKGSGHHDPSKFFFFKRTEQKERDIQTAGNQCVNEQTADGRNLMDILIWLGKRVAR